MCEVSVRGWNVIMLLCYPVAWKTLIIEMQMLLLVPYIQILTMDPVVLTVNGTLVVQGQLLV